jgi:hypothetical protein
MKLDRVVVCVEVIGYKFQGQERNHRGFRIDRGKLPMAKKLCNLRKVDSILMTTTA